MAIVPEFISVLRDIRDNKYPTIVTLHDEVVAKEALVNPHYTAIDAVYVNIDSVNGVDANETNINAVNANKTNVDTVAGSIVNVNIVGTAIADVTIVATDIDAIKTNATNIVDIQNAEENAQLAINSAAAASTSETNAGTSATAANLSAGSASSSASSASASATVATDKADEITSLSATATTLVPGSSATANYNSATGILTMGVPEGIQGAKGDQGDSFQVDATGTIAERVNYDNQLKGYSFFATDESLIYFKVSDTNADWDAGAPFGKGDTGNGIDNITKTGTTGLVDTYTITYTDGATFAYTVTNGADGDLLAVNNLSDLDNSATARTNLGVEIGTDVQAYNANVTIQGNTFNGVSQLMQTDASSKIPALDGSLIIGMAKAQVGLNSVDNTSDATKNSAIATLTNKTISNIEFTGSITEQVGVMDTVISATLGTVQTKTMTADVTFTDSMSDGQSMVLHLTTGGFTPAYPTITWIGGAEPTYTTTDAIVFYKIGTTLYGAYIGSVVA